MAPDTDVIASPAALTRGDLTACAGAMLLQHSMSVVYKAAVDDGRGLSPNIIARTETAILLGEMASREQPVHPGISTATGQLMASGADLAYAIEQYGFMPSTEAEAMLSALEGVEAECDAAGAPFASFGQPTTPPVQP